MTRSRRKQIDLAVEKLLGKRRPGRKKGTMTAEERREVSLRIKRYWATRKTGELNSSATIQ